jgi:hypothetical protein
MGRFSRVITLGLAFWGLTACGGRPAPAPSQAANAVVPHERLGRIVDRYWDENVLPGNSLSPQYLADSLALQRRFLAEILAVPRAGLDEDSRLTYDIFKRQRELDIDGFTYPSELLPVNPFDAMPLQFARAAAGAGQRPFSTARDYESWLTGVDEYVQWTGRAIVNMRDGMRRGYTLPRVLVERTLPLLQGFGEDTSANVFYIPLQMMPQTIDPAERTRLTASLTRAIKDKLLPAYRVLHDFLQSEYLPRARLSVGLSALPLGPSWYAALVKRAAGDERTPDQIHAVGTAEVERLQARMRALPAGPSPPGKAELVDAYSRGHTHAIFRRSDCGFRDSRRRPFWRCRDNSRLRVCGTGRPDARHSVCEYRTEWDASGPRGHPQFSAGSDTRAPFSIRAPAGTLRLAQIPAIRRRAGVCRRVGSVCGIAGRGNGPVSR